MVGVGVTVFCAGTSESELLELELLESESNHLGYLTSD